MHTDTRTVALENRVARLERRCIVLTAAAPVMIGAAVLVGMASGSGGEPGGGPGGPAVPGGPGGPNGPDVQEPVRASSFELVDESGTVRAALRMEGGGPGLHLMDEAGHARLSAWHDAGQTALFIRNDKDEVRLGTALFADGGAGYTLHAADGKGAAVLYMTGDAKPRLTFYAADGTVTYNAAPETKATPKED